MKTRPIPLASRRCQPAGDRKEPAGLHRRLAWVVCAGFVFGCPAWAAEISTNGVGGGPWSDPTTWRGKKVPGPDDEVIIRKLDVVFFDRADDGKPTCRKLQIDPRGGLTFKTGAGKLALTVPEGIESFGPIRLDGTRSASDHFTIRLTADKEAKRQLKLGRGGALLLYGRSDLPGGAHNVVLSAPRPADPKENPTGLVDAEGAVMIDWQRADIVGVKLSARKIDNTGARPNERIRVTECRFTGAGRVYCQNCDTPEVNKNTFDLAEPLPIPSEPAIHLHICPLAEVKGNRVRGPFYTGLGLYSANDAVVIDNTIEKCTHGLVGGYGVPNLMVKQLTIRGCPDGIRLESASGVLEDVTVEGSTTAYEQQNSTMQLNNFQVKDLAKKGGLAVLHEGGSLALQNCNIVPAQIKVVPQPPRTDGKPHPIPVVCQQCLVLRVKDAPPGTQVEVRTASPPVPAGVADANVRNSPAPVVKGLTPGPQSLGPLIVKGWSLDLAGKLVAGPEYGVKVLGPAPKEGAQRPALKTLTFRPPDSAFQAPGPGVTPTLEVSLK
jgi:hypothetical protein